MTNEGFVIPSALVRYLRRGVRRELAERIGDLALALEMERGIDTETYFGAVLQFEDTRALFEHVGIGDLADEPDLEIDLARWPTLTLHALETEYEVARVRVEDAELYGFKVTQHDVPALARLIEVLRKKTGARARRSHLQQDSLLRRLTIRRRLRGDG